MAQAASLVNNDPTPKPPRKSKKAFYRFKRYVVLPIDEFNSIGRALLQMDLLSIEQPCTMSAQEQADQLGVSINVVWRARRIGVEARLFRETADGKGFVKVELDGPSWSRRFNTSKFNLAFRTITLRLDLAAVAKDGKAHASTNDMAPMLNATPRQVRQALEVADGANLFEIELFPGGRNAYRPKLELVVYEKEEDEPPKRTSVRSILAHDFGIKYSIVAVAFVTDIIKPARRLQLTDDDQKLVRALGALYQDIKAERNNYPSARHNTPGLIEVMRQYIQYLEEEQLGWNRKGSLNVFSMDAPVFKQFRHEWREREWLDPINGKSKWER